MRRNTAPPRSSAGDSLDEYLDEIGRYPLLTRDQERALGRRIREGDRTAVDALVCANLRFVVSIASKYQGRSVALLDLIDEGNLGLLRAAHRFDETKGIKFISYAVWWIRQSILQALSEQSSLVRIPFGRVGTYRRVGRQANTLLQQLGREPTNEEIAAELDISEAEVVDAMLMSKTDLSLDAPTPNGDGNMLVDYLADTRTSADKQTFDDALTESVAAALSHLRERDVTVLRLYFGFGNEEPMTLEEIGSRLGVTRERVRQIRDRGLRKLRGLLPDLARSA